MLFELKKKNDFIISDFFLLFVCYLGMVDLHENARNICVAICPGFTKILLVCLDYKDENRNPIVDPENSDKYFQYIFHFGL